MYPDSSRERHLPAPLFFRRGTIGTHQVRQLGKGREFEQLCLYVPGRQLWRHLLEGHRQVSFPCDDDVSNREDAGDACHPRYFTAQCASVGEYQR